MKKDGGARRPSGVSRAVRRLLNRHVRRLQALRPLHEIELDRGSFREGSEPLGLDRREVHEHVLAAFRGDEAKALRVIEPLDPTGAAHVVESPYRLMLSQRQRWLLEGNSVCAATAGRR